MALLSVSPVSLFDDGSGISNAVLGGTVADPTLGNGVFVGSDATAIGGRFNSFFDNGGVTSGSLYDTPTADPVDLILASANNAATAATSTAASVQAAATSATSSMSGMSWLILIAIAVALYFYFRKG